jgi:hypothetical protein
LNPPTLPPITAPLRGIFWGGLLCVLDFHISSTSNGEGWRFDFLNDFVGMLTITWAVFRLSRIEVEPRYAIAMGFLKIVAVLGCVKALHGHLIYDTPLLISLLINLQGFLAMAATVIFCVAMQWLSRHAGLERSAGSWRVTTILFIVVYLIPLGLFYLASLVATVTGQSFNLNLGIGGLVLIPVFLIPLVHFFVSTSRMRDESMTRDDMFHPQFH